MNAVAGFAFGIGSRKTIDELIPLLERRANTETDGQILKMLATRIVDLVDVIGLAKVGLLMSSLEILVGRQNVSGSAIKSIKQIAQLNQVELFFDFLPLLRRLNQAVTNEARSAFPALIPVLYTLVQPAHKEELRNGFRFSCLDQSLMVRRAAVAQLAAFGKLIDQARLLEYIEPIIDGSDEDMKPPIVEACVSLIKYMPRQQKGQMVVRCLPYFRDRNMQLALVMARSLGVLSKATGRELRARLFDVARGVSDDVNIDLSVRNAMKASLKRLGEYPNL